MQPSSSTGEGAQLTSSSWLAGARNRDWLKTAQPVGQFVGFKQRHPFTIPSTVEWELRVPRNIKFYLTNYVLVVLLTFVAVMFLHPSLMVWFLVFTAAWVIGKRVLERPGIHIKLGPYTLDRRHLNMAFQICLVSSVFFIVGHTIFAFIGMSTSAILLHATFRTPTEEHGASTHPHSSPSVFLNSSATEAPVV